MSFACTHLIGFGAAAPVASGALLDGSESDGTNLIPTGGVGMTTGWSLEQGTLTNAAAVAPDGTTTASRFNENTNNSRHIVYRQNGVFNYSINRTFSIYAKQIGRRYIQLLPATTTNNKAYVYADLQDGVITASGAVASASLVSSQIEAAVNGFWKVTMVCNLAEASNNAYFQVNLSDRSTHIGTIAFDAPSYTGDGSSDVYLWRPKVV